MYRTTQCRGTAPGMWFEKEGVIYVSLPGVPHEMKGLMQQQVIPRLKKQLTLPVIVHETLLTAGIGESMIADILVDFENNLPAHLLNLLICLHYGMVRLRLTAIGSDKAGNRKRT